MGWAAPRRPELLAGAFAGAVSLLFLWLGPASPSWLAMQVGGIALALLILATPSALMWRDAVVLLLVPALMAATLLFEGADGVRRWLVLGSLRLHAGLLLVPLLLITHARRGDAWSALAMALVALVVVLQPDRATALALTLGATAVAAMRRDRINSSAALAALLALAVTLVRPDGLGPVPLVEGVFAQGWAMASWLGVPMLLAAIGAILVPLAGGARAPAALACTAAWSGFLIASLLGSYPVPLIGFGLSAWIGWGLSVRATRA
jgi:hypothetical protein